METESGLILQAKEYLLSFSLLPTKLLPEGVFECEVEYNNVIMYSKRIWFKRKTYGWGWTPATWQGWLVTGVYLALISLLVLSREKAIPGNPDSGTNFLVFGIPFIALTALFIFVAYKTGEKPKWQWGLPKDK